MSSAPCTLLAAPPHSVEGEDCLIHLTPAEQWPGDGTWSRERIVAHLARHGRPLLRRLLAGATQFSAVTSYEGAGPARVTHLCFGRVTGPMQEMTIRHAARRVITATDPGE